MPWVRLSPICGVVAERPNLCSEVAEIHLHNVDDVFDAEDTTRCGLAQSVRSLCSFPGGRILEASDSDDYLWWNDLIGDDARLQTTTDHQQETPDSMICCCLSVKYLDNSSRPHHVCFNVNQLHQSSELLFTYESILIITCWGVAVHNLSRLKFATIGWIIHLTSVTAPRLLSIPNHHTSIKTSSMHDTLISLDPACDDRREAL